MRSFEEMTFRAKQEATNVYLLAANSQFTTTPTHPLPLPDGKVVADALQGSEFAEFTLEWAERILEHKVPLLGTCIETGKSIDWRRDYQHDRVSDLRYFRRIPYLDFQGVGDHKFIWELNRQQHLVLLAQAFCLRRDQRYIAEILAQLESWRIQNPFQRGMNWTSALEVAFRALSWVWIYHLAGGAFPEQSVRALVSGLYQHALHLEANLSVYFSPNTHLLGEAVALYTIGVCFPEMPHAEKWRKKGQDIVFAEVSHQVRPDGSHFEQSTYYHVYALDFFLWFYLLAGRPETFRPTLTRMAEYLHWLLGARRAISFFGDDDGGRLFYPYGDRYCFGRSTQATCGVLFEREEWLGNRRDLSEQAAWWLGTEVLENSVGKPRTPAGGRIFSDSGTVFLQNQDIYVQFDAGPFGYGGAGHSHSDSLSFCAERKGQSLLIDPGTFTYISDPEERNWFRGSAAHNTVCVDGRSQAIPETPFRWSQKPQVRLLDWGERKSGGWVEAECEYAGCRHRRRLLLDGDLLMIIDDLSGEPGEHACEQWWHWGPLGSQSMVLSASESMNRTVSRYSPAYGVVLPGDAAVVRTTATFPVAIATVIAPVALEISTAEAVRLFDRFKML